MGKTRLKGGSLSYFKDYYKEHNLKNILLSFLFILLLTGCGQHVQETGGQLKVLPVEFNSGATLQKKKIQLLDSNGTLIDENMTNADGEVVFKELVEGQEYFIRIGEVIPSTNVLFHETLIEYSSRQQSLVIQTYAGSDYSTLAVPTVLQNPELPHGCEITSLTALFNYYGLNISKLEMADDYLPKGAIQSTSGKSVGPDPAKMYVNNPRDKANGKYVFVEPIIQTSKEVINDHNLPLKPLDLSGSSLDQLENMIRDGIPIVLWLTIDLQEPRTRGGWYIENTTTFHEQYMNLHAAVIIGQTNSTFKLMDPLRGIVEHPKKVIYDSYLSLGGQAMTLIVN